MSRFEGALARKLDFGDWPTTVTSTGWRGNAGLRLDPRLGLRTGPDKYRALEHRRRQAQMNARHLLALIEDDGFRREVR